MTKKLDNIQTCKKKMNLFNRVIQHSKMHIIHIKDQIKSDTHQTRLIKKTFKDATNKVTNEHVKDQFI